jgi:ribose transport system substrate-binding protein
MTKHTNRRSAVMSATALAAVAVALAGCSSNAGAATSSPSSSNGGTLQIAYLSFAVANSYDAPMLAAAQAEADDSNAKLTVFDANNDPQAQFSQLQDAITSGKYQGIITQPILGTALAGQVQQAIAQGIKVVNIDQILGSDLSTNKVQVKGLSANVTFVPTDIGTQLGQQVIEACASRNLDPCNVGYLYDIKASALDVAMNKSFLAATSSTPAVKIVAEGEDFFTPANGLKAVQDMLQSHPELNLIVGSDQGLQGAVQALSATNKTGKVLLVGFGGSAAAVKGVGSGDWYSDVAQAPATEGRLGVRALVQAIRNGTDGGSIDPFAKLPNHGLITKDNAKEFVPEWPG